MTVQTATAAKVEPYGACKPDAFARLIIAATGRLPEHWLGLRLAIALRRLVMMRLGEDGGLDVERFGLRVRLHPRHNGCEKGLLFTPQFYEAPERAALAEQIEHACAAGRPFVFVDAGANVGLFSLYVASRARTGAKILAIEPEPENLRRLRFNLAANDALPIKVIPIALGEAAGRLSLEIDRRDRGGTRTRFDERGGLMVECKPLLDVLRAETIERVDALKIDIEGIEDRILLPFFDSAPQSLWPIFILIEDSRKDWRHDVVAELQARGYNIIARSRQNVMLERR